MKPYLLIAFAAIILSACTQAKLDKAALDKSTIENDSLKGVVTEQDASLNDFIGSFNEIEKNLDSVAARQKLITINTSQQGDLKPSQLKRINDGIAAINTFMDENRKQLTDMKRKLRNSASKNAELSKAIATINNKLAQKDVELIALNEVLYKLNAQVNDLETALSIVTQESREKSETIERETIAMHTAYYIVAESKELKESKIIDRNGGLLGMGKTSTLSSNIDNNKFNKIDYTQTTTIEVNGTMKMITTHPQDSYSLNSEEKNEKKIINISITNPERFWSATKYLVIQKN